MDVIETTLSFWTLDGASLGTPWGEGPGSPRDFLRSILGRG